MSAVMVNRVEMTSVEISEVRSPRSMSQIGTEVK